MTGHSAAAGSRVRFAGALLILIPLRCIPVPLTALEPLPRFDKIACAEKGNSCIRSLPFSSCQLYLPDRAVGLSEAGVRSPLGVSDGPPLGIAEGHYPGPSGTSPRALACILPLSRSVPGRYSHYARAAKID